MHGEYIGKLTNLCQAISDLAVEATSIQNEVLLEENSNEAMYTFLENNDSNDRGNRSCDRRMVY
jgi:hypothetical protein